MTTEQEIKESMSTERYRTWRALQAVGNLTDGIRGILRCDGDEHDVRRVFEEQLAYELQRNVR